MGKLIYLDNAATTKTDPEVVEAMIPYFSENYGNPSSIYELAGKSKTAMEEAREKIAGVLNARTNEIYFTAGEAKQTTGRWWRPLTLTPKRETTLLQRKLNTMQFCIPVNIWRNTEEQGLRIWMWTKTEL